MRKRERTNIPILLLCFLLSTIPIFGQVSPALPSNPDHFPEIVERAMPTVVTVYSEQTIRVQYRDPWFFRPDEDFFRRFFGGPDYSPREQQPQYREYRREGLGSGVIITEDGYILTNNHVVENADEIRVKVGNIEHEAEIVGADEKTDIAVLKTNPDEPLTAAKLGDSDDIRIGEWVLAIGHPFELDHTVTAGIISAKGRNRMGITDYEDFIQTDAAINPGNSGGALVNLKAEVIGINTAIASRTGVYSGIGFAIPINMARLVMDQLIEYGYVSRGYIGIGIQDITPELAEAFDLEEPSGVLVTQVMPDTPGDDAGLKSGDIIISMGGEKLDNGTELRNRVAAQKPGSTIDLEVIRDGKQKKFDIMLTQLPGTEELIADVEETEPEPEIGLKLSPAKESEVYDYGYSGGLIVEAVEPESPADKAGVLPGDIIFEVNRETVNSNAEFDKLVAESFGKEPVLLLIGRGGGMLYLVVMPDE